MTQTVSSNATSLDLNSPYLHKDIVSFQAHVQAHPLGIRPSGNALSIAEHARANIGTFGILPDEVILISLEWLKGIDLLRLGRTCRALFAFTSFEELWKAILIQEGPLKSSWQGSWRATYIGCPASKLPNLDCNLCSDALYRPFFCSQIDLSTPVTRIPLHNRVPRLTNLSQAEFSNSWSDRPFILTEPVSHWPVFSQWCQEALVDRYGRLEFRAEAVDWPLGTYIDYMNNNQDESPLYLFDNAFVEKMDLTVNESHGAYWPPHCFGEDLFALLGKQRPDNRWLIIGPARSGSTFHKDPNATSAWNAVIRGSKYWIMFPGSTLPPGVYVSADQGEVTSPLSIAEWLLSFHEEARRMTGCIEGICHEGEVLHVPSGWWHLVVNLEPAIAITQNFISRSGLVSALDFLARKPDQVSGFSNDVEDPYNLFLDRLRAHQIDVLDQQPGVNGKKRKWKEIVEKPAASNAVAKAGFNFAFEDDVEEDIS